MVEIDKIRPMVSFIKEKEGNNKLIGVEIGVKTGTHAKTMLDNLNISTLYLIDPYNEINNYYGQTRAREFYITLKTTILKDYPNTLLIKKTSIEALNDIPNGVDFIYIDGSHAYNDVSFDINNYINKVKIDGVFGGHDYTSDLYPGVRQAVDEFINKTGYELYTKYTTFPSIRKAETDWWVVKE